VTYFGGQQAKEGDYQGEPIGDGGGGGSFDASEARRGDAASSAAPSSSRAANRACSRSGRICVRARTMLSSVIAVTGAKTSRSSSPLRRWSGAAWTSRA
jgi:hypothetical protein